MEKENLKTVSETVLDKVKNRNSVLKIIVVSVFSILLAYKLALSDVNFDFTKFDFSDLLSLVMALFSIALSVAFYFKIEIQKSKELNLGM